MPRHEIKEEPRRKVLLDWKGDKSLRVFLVLLAVGSFASGRTSRATRSVGVAASGRFCDEATLTGYSRAASALPARDGLRFDGVNDVVTAASSSLQMTTGLTLEAWILPELDENPGWGGIIAGNDGEFLLAYTLDSRIAWALNGSAPGFHFVNSAAMLPTKVRSHVAMTYDGSNVRIYVGGILASTQTATGPIKRSSPPMSLFRIGTRYYGKTWYFAGIIDHVAVWDAPLSPATIAAHAAQAGIDVNHPNL
jgi:concanavalin A-like lectin/glucanase superfamily protein